MKKLLILLSFVFLLSGVLAVSGVSPGSHSVDFESGLQRDFIFDFFIDGGIYVQPYVEGDLAEYVSLDKDKLYGREKITATLNLPDSIKGEGTKEIKIVAGGATGIIKVNLPIKNKYFKMDLRAPTGNVGELIEINLGLENIVGHEIEIIPRLEIYFTGNLEVPLDIFYFGKDILFNESSFSHFLDTRNYSFGAYVAIAIVEYNGEEFRIENPFSLGKKDLEILDYTKGMKEGRVGKFEIEVKSFWNDNIDELYAEVMVVGSEYSFVTSSIRLDPWGQGIIEGFFDTRGIEGYNKKLNIILYYEDKIDNEIVDFIIKEKFDFTLLFVILTVCVVCVLLIIKGKLFFEKLNKSFKKNGK